MPNFRSILDQVLGASAKAKPGLIPPLGRPGEESGLPRTAFPDLSPLNRESRVSELVVFHQARRAYPNSSHPERISSQVDR